MRIDVTLLITGAAGPYHVVADEAVEGLADQLRGTDNPKLRVRTETGDLVEAAIITDTIRIRKLGDGRQALTAQLELPDGALTPVPPIAVHTGAEITEEERARVMPALEPDTPAR